VYFDRAYLEGIMGTGQVSGALVYGGTPTAQTASILSNYIEASSNYCDAFLDAGGYSVPLSPVPDMIKQIAAQHCAKQLLIRSNSPVPASLDQQLVSNEAILLAVRDGRVLIPGFDPSDEGAAAGGHSISNASSSSSSSSSGPFFSRGSLFGTWD